jgi:exopolyphosphatase/guanosine-5'-triphosphate,3'-diphosphate pyrophosphatase
LINKITAAIDIGSYNCRMIIVNNAPKIKVLKTISVPTNLIKNLSYSNEFTHENIKKTVKCLTMFSRKMLEYNVSDYRCVATEACRQVINSDFFTEEVKNKTGLSVEIISVNEEAKLCFQSCKKYFKRINNEGILFDIGGGSTEISFFNVTSEKFETDSIPLGVINLSEKINIHGKSKIISQMNRHFKSLNSDLSNQIDPSFSLGSCSTMSTLSAIYQNLTFFDKKKIEGSLLDVGEIMKIINNLKNLKISEMLKHPCIRKRYPLLLNGIAILEKILENFPIKKILVSQSGLTGGMIENLN